MKDFLDSVADSNSLIDAVFPVDDVYNILGGEIGSTDSGDVQSISLKKQIAQKVTMNNRSKLGLYSALSLLNDKTLNDIVDESTLELQEKIDMNNVQFEKHAAITEIVGLPLPYEDEEQDSNVDLIGKSDEAQKIENENEKHAAITEI